MDFLRCYLEIIKFPEVGRNVELRDDYALSDGEIDIVLYEKSSSDVQKGLSPEYKFHILLHGTDTIVGHINLRLGDTDKILKYIGYIGYGIDEQYRGNRYSAKACLLIKKAAKELGMKNLLSPVIRITMPQEEYVKL